MTVPYAVICVSISAYNSIGDAPNGTNISDWHLAAEQAVSAATQTERHLVVDDNDSSNIAIVVNNRTLQDANQLTRIVRNHLMRNAPSVNLSLAAAQVDNSGIDVDGILAEIHSDLSLNIEQGSSRITVKHYTV